MIMTALPAAATSQSFSKESKAMFGQLLKGAACVIAFAAPAAAAEIQLTTLAGTVSVQPNPTEVITFDLGTLDTLTALEVDVAGVPSPIYVPALEHLDDGTRPHIGTLFEPDYEQVFALKPDLILTGPRTREQIEFLGKIAPTVDMSPFSDDIEKVVKTQTTELGALFGKEAKATDLVDQLHTSLETLRALTKDAGKGLIVMTNGPKLSAFGPGSRFGWVHETFGVEPLLDNVDAETHGEAISFEFLHEVNPDWLIVFDRTKATRGDGATADVSLNNELVAQTTAMQKGQVIYVHPADFYIATTGVRSLQDTVDQFIAAFGAVQ